MPKANRPVEKWMLEFWPSYSLGDVSDLIRCIDDGKKTAMEILAMEEIPASVRVWMPLHSHIMSLANIVAFAGDCAARVSKREAKSATSNEELKAAVDSAYSVTEIAFKAACAAQRSNDYGNFGDDESVGYADAADVAAEDTCAAAAHATAVAAVAHAGYVGTTYPSEVHNNIKYERRWQLERLRYYLLREISLL